MEFLTLLELDRYIREKSNRCFNHSASEVIREGYGFSNNVTLSKKELAQAG